MNTPFFSHLISFVSHSCITFQDTTSPMNITPFIPCTLTMPPPIISTTTPSFPPSPSIPLSSSKDWSEPPHSYNLRSRSHSEGQTPSYSGLGLALPGSFTKSSHGRKSYLSKAIQKAGAEVVSGKQSSFDRVLRVLNTQGRFPP